MESAKLVTIWTAWILVVSATVSPAQGQDCQTNDKQPTVWLGDEEDAFYCKGDVAHCDHFGLDYVCEDPNGGSLDPCINGTKVKCASPPAIPLASPTPATTIRVVAYNIYEVRYLYYQNGQRERTCRIPRILVEMHPDIDVIVFNEVFMGGCFAPFNTTIESSTLTIRDILDQYGFNYYTDTVGVGEKFPRVENGGAFIASRWPIVKTAARVFNISTIYSFIAKGVVYTMINKTVEGESMMYHVFGTHMQAFGTREADNVRVTQATIIHDFMQEQGITADEPVIYAGDLNAPLNTTNGDEVVAALDATLPRNVGELKFTYDIENNDMFNDINATSSWLDYVLFSRSHAQPLTATVQVVRPRVSVPLQICTAAISAIPTYPNSEQCLQKRTITDLSDHYSIMGTFQYNRETMVTTVDTTTESGAASYALSVWLAGVSMIFALLGKM